MIKELTRVVSDLDAERVERLNEQFISEAEEYWDKIGEGCFAVFVEAYVNYKWYWFMRMN